MPDALFCFAWHKHASLRQIRDELYIKLVKIIFKFFSYLLAELCPLARIYQGSFVAFPEIDLYPGFAPGLYHVNECGLIRKVLKIIVYNIMNSVSDFLRRRKQHHLFGTVMPFVLLGLLPMLAGIFLRNPYVLFLGTMMASGAAGDLMIIRKVLGYKSIAKEVVYMDHPTEAGGVVFER